MKISYCKHKGCPNREAVPGAFRAQRGFCAKHAPLPSLHKARANRGVPPVLRSADGVDAGASTISEPLTVEKVRARAAKVRSFWGPGVKCRTHNAIHDNAREREALYVAVLETIATDRGPLGDLARAALEAEPGSWTP